MVKNVKNKVRLYCKDSKNMSDLESGAVNLMITSPPYFDLKEYNKKDNHPEQIGSISNYQDYVSNLNAVWKECVRVLAPDGKMCINIMPLFLSGTETSFKRRVTKLVITDIEKFMESTGEMFLHALFIWDKRKIVRFSSFGSYPYPPNIFSTFPFEWIIVFSKKGKRPPVSKEIKEKSKITVKEWQGWAINSLWDLAENGKKSSKKEEQVPGWVTNHLWEMQPAKAKTIGHPAPFPEELPRRLIKLYSFWGDTVLDPFLGSGTTAIAACKLGRNAVGYEINPDYIKIAKQKISLLTPELSVE
jgi:DNA modification methylase